MVKLVEWKLSFNIRKNALLLLSPFELKLFLSMIFLGSFKWVGSCRHDWIAPDLKLRRIYYGFEGKCEIIVCEFFHIIFNHFNFLWLDGNINQLSYLQVERYSWLVAVDFFEVLIFNRKSKVQVIGPYTNEIQVNFEVANNGVLSNNLEEKEFFA